VRRRIWSLLIAALLGTLLSGVVFAPSASAVPRECQQPALPRLPTGATAANPRLILQARQVAVLGHLDAAKALYERALTGSPPDPSAAFGLAYVTARRAAAAELAGAARRLAAAGKAEDSTACLVQALTLDAANSAALAAQNPEPAVSRTRAEKAASGWDAFYKAWVDPAVRIVLPALAVLAVLLVLARLLTPLAVPPDAEAWADARPRLAWWAGVVLMSVAAVVGLSAAVGATSAPQPRAWLSIVVLTAGIAAAASLAVLGMSRRGGRWIWLGMWSVLAVGIIGYGFLAPQTGITVPRRWYWWLLAAALAAVGCLLVAGGRGHALRLQILVKQGNDIDPVGTAYVLGRLQELGSSPPRGLKTPQQVDVTDLPNGALSSLPVGRLATVLAPLAGLLTPSVPWRATVEDGLKDQAVLVTLTRNGSVAQTALVDATRFLPRPAVGAPVAATPDLPERGDLLTAAAAVVLTELAKRHTVLRDGLCGASRWDSVAAYVVATKPPASAGGYDLRRGLLAYAVEADPGNAFARLAYANLLGENAASPGDLRQHIELLTSVREGIDEEAGNQPGFLALRLRALHTLTATELNLAASESGTARATAVAAASGDIAAFRDLVTSSMPGRDAGQQAFLHEMNLIAGQLESARDVLLGEPGGDVVKAIGLGRSLYVLYDEACRLALDQPAREPARARRDRAAALDRLHVTAGLQELRDSAVRDPWFAALRAASGDLRDDAQRFWRIVGAAEPAFTDLPPFGTNGEALRAIGIERPEDLLAVTGCPDGVENLATSLKISPCVVEGWRTFAELASPRGVGGPTLSSRELGLLAWSGVRTRDTLRTCSAQDLADRLAAEATERRLMPPSLTDVESWLTRATDEHVRDEPAAQTEPRPDPIVVRMHLTVD
jgi:hypothetical protein